MKSLLLLLTCCCLARAADFAALCADRAAIERVYHDHRTGTKPAFEQAMPAALVEKMVRADLQKEAVLERVYRVKIAPEMIAAEVQRIDATTRAPEMLAEIKAALGHDPARFAAAMARPIVVERTLRARFENDAALHAPQRREAEQARADLRAGKAVAGMREVTWQLGPRPEEENAKLQTSNSKLQTTPTPAAARSGSYSVEATVQLAQPLTPPPGERDRPHYFDDLDPELQRVLRVQLQSPGDVSAVIETPGGFLLFLAQEKTAATLRASSLSLPKRSYDQWLADQPD